MLTLQTYFQTRGRRQQLASALDTHPNYLWQIAKGRRKAGFQLAIRIEDATRGAVSRESLRPDYFGKATQKRGTDKTKKSDLVFHEEHH